MLNIFNKLVEKFLNETVTKNTILNIPTREIGRLYVVYTKAPGADIARYTVYSLDASAKPLDVEKEAKQQRVWLNLYSLEGSIHADAVVGILPEYRTPIMVDINKPLLSWATVPVHIHGFI